MAHGTSSFFAGTITGTENPRIAGQSQVATREKILSEGRAGSPILAGATLSRSASGSLSQAKKSVDALQRSGGFSLGQGRSLAGLGAESNVNVRNVFTQAQNVNPLSFANIAAENVSQQFDRAGDITRRNLSRLGVNPSSGRFASTLLRNRLAEAAGRTSAFQNELLSARQLSFNQNLSAAGLGNQIRGIGLQSTSIGNAAFLGAGNLSLASSRQANTLAGQQVGLGFAQQSINALRERQTRLADRREAKQSGVDTTDLDADFAELDDVNTFTDIDEFIPAEFA